MINNDSNDEYKLNEEEGYDEHLEGNVDYQEESPTQTTPSGNAPFIKKTRLNRLLIPIGIIVAIFVVYNILNWYSTRKSETEAKQQEVAAIEKKPAPVEQIQTAAPVIAQPQIQQQPSATQEELNNVAKSYENVKEQLLDLNQKLIANQEAVSDLSKKMDQLAGAVVTIQDELTKAQEEAEKQKNLKKAKPKAVKPPPVYHVRAIVPGRAWLETSTGKTVTVRVGNRLEGYGIIEAISPKQGMVVTSSGTIIQYGVNDF